MISVEKVIVRYVDLMRTSKLLVKLIQEKTRLVSTETVCFEGSFRFND